MTRSIVIAPVVRVDPNPDDPDNAVLLTIRCPYCGDEHTHGDRRGAGPFYGSRAVHCVYASSADRRRRHREPAPDDRGEYELVDTRWADDPRARTAVQFLYDAGATIRAVEDHQRWAADELNAAFVSVLRELEDDD